MNIRLKKKIDLVQGALGVGMALLLVGLPAHAQEKVDKIEVTGSNIRRTDAETASPVQVITRKEIEQSGKQTISDVVRSLSADNNGSVSLAFSNGFAAGASGVSLRGLTVNSTLVLVNGRRMAPYGLGDDGQRSFVDLSSIPFDAVERVEVLKDGASAIYGSDAIAGVINIILRKDFVGASLGASTGVSRYGDGKTKRVNITAGFGDIAADKYNFMGSAEISTQQAIQQRDRKDRKWIGSGDVRPYGYLFGDGGGGGLRGGIGGDILGPNGAFASLVGNVRDPITKLYQSLGGCQTAPDPDANGGCVWDTNDYFQIQPSEERTNVFGRGSFAISSTTLGYAELGVFESKVLASSTPSGISGQWPDIANNTIVNNSGNLLPANHPDNPFGAAARIRYGFGDVGPRTQSVDTTVTRLLAGVKGTLADWDYDSGVLYAESTSNNVQKGYIRQSVLLPALNGTGPYGFYRFGGATNSPALLAALSPALVSASETSITSVDFKANRELTQLAGGAMGLAVGGEYRLEKNASPPVPFTAQADIVGLGYASFNSSRHVGAVFAEIGVPVTKSLELSVALRDDHYSDFGNSFTPKLGIKFTPIKEIALRGTYGQGFRAPGPAENGNSGSAGFTNYSDPVRCPDGNNPLPGASQADCAGSAVVITTGNPQIKPEKSKSFTLGAIIAPTNSSSVSIDLWQITRTNEITGADPAQVLLNPSAFPTAIITRDPTNDLPGIPNSGTVFAVSAPYINANQTKTNGVDLDLRQKFNFGGGNKLTAGLIWTYVNKFERTLPGIAPVDYAGTHGPTSLSGNGGTPRHKGSLDLAWDQANWGVATKINYVGSMKNVEFKDQPCLNTFADGSDAPGGCKIASFTTVDLSGNFTPLKGLEFNASILNLFDRIAPLDPQTYGANNYNPTLHLSGAIGRFYQAGVKYKF
jgi:iron complex outermembrane recepter protein